jgi:hypothetical protein
VSFLSSGFDHVWTWLVLGDGSGRILLNCGEEDDNYSYDYSFSSTGGKAGVSIDEEYVPLR